LRRLIYFQENQTAAFGSKTVPSIPQSLDNPPTSGLGSKPGRPYTLVLVGCEDYLYKTSKPLSNRSNQKSSSSRSSSSKVVSIDLHGLTKVEALRKLDNALSDWIDSAMKGSYPL